MIKTIEYEIYPHNIELKPFCWESYSNNTQTIKFDLLRLLLEFATLTIKL